MRTNALATRFYVYAKIATKKLLQRICRIKKTKKQEKTPMNDAAPAKTGKRVIDSLFRMEVHRKPVWSLRRSGLLYL